MELKAGLAVLLVLLISNSGIANAGRQRVADVGKHFLRADSTLKHDNRAQSGERQLIGSSVPECGHTCGACSPCQLQVVSYECTEAWQFHAEDCPLRYLCICHGKSFPIP